MCVCVCERALSQCPLLQFKYLLGYSYFPSLDPSVFSLNPLFLSLSLSHTHTYSQVSDSIRKD